VAEGRPWDMRPRVFCIGLNKTGTSSFHTAMEILGLKSLHWGGPPVRRTVEAAIAEGRHLLSGLDAAIDAFSDVEPVTKNFDVLDKQYPGSRFVLTVRPLDEWIDSRRRHVKRNIARRQAGTYDGSFLIVDEEGWRNEWHDHVDRARRYFAGHVNFLEVDLTATAEWSPLCTLLDLPEPSVPFPWANRDCARSPDPC
jgi:hypothetical protein